MAVRPVPPLNRSEFAEPAWEIARLFPAQGLWSETDYLDLNTNRLVEYSQGRVEVLAMPTDEHQTIVAYLFTLLSSVAQALGGKALFAPLRLRLKSGKFREPDLVMLFKADDERRHNDYWDGADLVMEVVSPDDPDRDWIVKRQEYAQAGIAEYWIIDPRDETVTVFKLEHGAYVEHGRFARGATATSALLADLKVDVAAVFEAR
jgi:Uma2 family endonuclease